MLSFAPPADDAQGQLFDQGQSETIGTLAWCDGVNATILTDGTSDTSEVAVGQMLSIAVGTNRVIGLVYQLEHSPLSPTGLSISLELQGQILVGTDGSLNFSKGIARYPSIGAPAGPVKANDLAALYASSGNRNAVIGSLSQDTSIPAYIDVESMLSKHFAILGSTGSGKSSAVALLMRASQEMVPDLHTLFLDPHNEYGTAFPESKKLGAENLNLPFWLFHLEEYAETLFRGKPIVEDEIEALRDFIPVAKQTFRDGEQRTSLRTESASTLTADAPAPYRMSDLLSQIDEELGTLEARFNRSVLKSLRSRIVAHCADPRYRFMFRDKSITDNAESTLEQVFNLSSPQASMTILQMAGMPSEVVNAIASVLCRLAFELCVAAQGGIKVAVMCEEAHRYIPADPNGGFEPTRRAIARIAKEGRKYGCFLGIVSQRPAELDATILSQCSTVFALRMANDNDQDLIRKAISSSSSSTISFLSSLANREAIAFGEGLSTPMRLKFRNLPQEWLPGRDQSSFSDNSNAAQGRANVLRRWRGVTGAAPMPPQRPVS